MFAARTRSTHHRLALGVVATLTAGALLAPAALAGPFDQRVVAGDAAWTVHIDVEAAVNSTLGQFILHEGPNLGIDLSHLEEAEAQLGVNPLDVVFGATIYGMGAMGDAPVIVITGSAALEDFLAQHAQNEQANIETVRIGDAIGYVIDEEWFIAVGQGPRAGTRRFVAAPGMDSLRDALRVVVGAANHKEGGAKPGPGSIVFVDASGLIAHGADFGGNNFAAGMLESIRSVVIDVGESAGDVSVSLRARLSDADEARNIHQMVQGLFAMGQMMAQQRGDAEDAKQLAEVLQALSINVEGDAISLDIRYNAQQLIHRALEELGEDAPH